MGIGFAAQYQVRRRECIGVFEHPHGDVMCGPLADSRQLYPALDKAVQRLLDGKIHPAFDQGAGDTLDCVYPRLGNAHLPQIGLCQLLGPRE